MRGTSKSSRRSLSRSYLPQIGMASRPTGCSGMRWWPQYRHRNLQEASSGCLLWMPRTQRCLSIQQGLSLWREVKVHLTWRPGNRPHLLLRSGRFRCG